MAAYSSTWWAKYWHVPAWWPTWWPVRYVPGEYRSTNPLTLDNEPRQLFIDNGQRELMLDTDVRQLFIDNGRRELLVE